MKILDLERDDTDLGACIQAAQAESLLIMRAGKPAALIIGVEGHDADDLDWETNPEFWGMIAERRQQPTMSRAELDEYLRRHDQRGKKKK